MCICNMCEDAIRGPGYASCCWLLDRRIHCPAVSPHLDTRCGDVELGWTIVVVNGIVVNGFAVPWEIQTTNTCPENFMYDDDKSSILTIAPGLYEINFGFFCQKNGFILDALHEQPGF